VLAGKQIAQEVFNSSWAMKEADNSRAYSAVRQGSTIAANGAQLAVSSGLLCSYSLNLVLMPNIVYKVSTYSSAAIAAN
jgi:hypothetical protein